MRERALGIVLQEWRRSRTVRGEPRGAIPRGYSTAKRRLGGGEILGGDSVSSVAAVYDRRRCLNCCTVGAHRAPLQLRDPQIFETESLPKHLFRPSGVGKLDIIAPQV